MATSDTLNFIEKPMIDEIIKKFEYHEFQCRFTNLNSPGDEISITINQEGLFTLPSEAYTHVEGRLLKAEGTYYANTDAVTLVNNCIMYLFNRAEYSLSGQSVKNIINLGRATTILGLFKYPNYFQNVQGMNQIWYKDSSTSASIAANAGFAARQSYLIQSPNAKRKFSFCVPLIHIFGFYDTYDKVVYGLTHTLTLIRDGNNNAIFKALGAALDGKVNLTKVSLFMPHVKPHLEFELKLNKEIESKVPLPVSYSERHCQFASVPRNTDFTWTLNITSCSTRHRFIIVGFQTNKNGSQEQNSAIFDHCDMKNMYVTLNSQSYPKIVNYNLSFPDQQFSRAYRDASLFTKKFYGMNDLLTQCSINLSEYKDLYPLFVFDVSKQSAVLKTSIINVQFKTKFNTAVPANSMGYAVVISD
ncbi:uncharacterized protein LOC124819094 [Hydra vulgaris]|uniref:uncharacterized protein LOC124819094 n=1 Tax=Hydra vulgaris TaxID=6087 RepID=UPI001F5FEA7F|nr:uncharacterized protein LOC124819094 [Hydra vulgaris]